MAAAHPDQNPVPNAPSASLCADHRRADGIALPGLPTLLRSKDLDWPLSGTFQGPVSPSARPPTGPAAALAPHRSSKLQ